MRIALLVADNRYATTAHFAQGLSRALIRCGMTVAMYDVKAEEGMQLQDALEVFQPDWTLSFSDLTFGGQGLGDSLQRPHFFYLLDPPPFFLHHMQGDYTALSCVDQGHVQWVTDVARFERVCWLPHAVACEDFREVAWKDKSYDLVYFGSCLDPQMQMGRWEQLYSAQEQKLLQELASCVLTTPHTVWDVLYQASLPEDKLLTFYHELDHLVRAQDRIQLLSALPPHRLTIWGDGPWKRYVPTATCYAPVSFLDMLQLMRQAKIVLNSSPRFKQGFHERIFYAFASSACVMTSYSSEVAQQFPAVMCYSTPQPELLCETLDVLDQQGETLMEYGREMTKKKHTWDHRASSLVTWMRQWHCGQRA